MFSIKSLSSTLAAAGLVSVIGLAYAQTTTQPSEPLPTTSGTPSATPGQSSTTGVPADAGTQSPSTTGNTPMSSDSSTTQGGTPSSESGFRADGTSTLEPRADRN